MPIQQMLLGAGAGAETVYIDDVFSTYVYKGNGGSSRTISNGIDQLGKGAMTWIKNRNSNQDNILVDSERGPTKRLVSNGTGAESTDSSVVHSFKSTGFRIGNSDKVNNSSYTYSSWSFRKQAGFFDVVTYSGTGSTQSVAHSLGTTPGFIMVKNLDGSENWSCYHKGIDTSSPEDYKIHLNYDESRSNSNTAWNDTAPTSTHFTVKSDGEVNGNGVNYVAYLFAGGVGGSSSNIDITSKTVTSLGGAFSGSYPMSNVTDGTAESENAENIGFVPNSNGIFDIYVDLSSPYVVTKYRIAPQGDAGTQYNLPALFEVYGTNDTSSWNYVTTVNAGHTGWSAPNYRDFELNNTNTYRYWRIRNLQNKDSSGASGGGTSISEWKMEGYSKAVDTGLNVFGESGDQNIIKCGSYTGNGATDGPRISLGWEPQWILFKNVTTTSGRDWCIVDSIRGAIAGSGSVRQLRPNENNSEGNATAVSIEPTGFKITDGNAHYNENGETIIYMAIRRPDGYVGKPADAATDIFTIDLGGINAGDPSWVSNFPVDMQFIKDRNGTTYNYFLSSRLTHSRYLTMSAASAQISNSVYTHDYMNGWGNYSSSDAEIITSWMWKRGAGFDVVCYEGDGISGRSIPHSLNAVPQMIWCKNRETSDIWTNGHFGTNGGTNPWHYRLRGNSSTAQEDYDSAWYDTAPTSTQFTVGNHEGVNTSGNDYIAFLFTSISGISKLGYYDGSNSEQTITVGFQPRFLMIRRTDDGNDWLILDTFRGWASGNDEKLRWNSNVAQDADDDFGAPTSTGFTLAGNNGITNTSGGKFIYYAHG